MYNHLSHSHLILREKPDFKLYKCYTAQWNKEEKTFTVTHNLIKYIYTHTYVHVYTHT